MNFKQVAISLSNNYQTFIRHNLIRKKKTGFWGSTSPSLIIDTIKTRFISEYTKACSSKEYQTIFLTRLETCLTEKIARDRLLEIIQDNRFKINKGYSEILKKILKNIVLFTDNNSKKIIADAIDNADDLNDTDVLHTLTENLGVFTGEDSQKSISHAIRFGKFGNEPTVLNSLAENLKIFTDPTAQIHIAGSICRENFGNEPTVLTKIAENLEIFTNPTAQIFIAEAVNSHIFGEEPTVLTTIAENLKIFTDPQAQIIIAEAIRSNVFEADTTVLSTLAKNLGVFTDLQAKTQIKTAIVAGCYGNDLESKLKSLAQFSFSLRHPIEEVTQFLLTSPNEDDAYDLTLLFGSQRYSSDDVCSIIQKHFEGLESEGIVEDECSYVLQVYNRKLILLNITGKENHFIGWQSKTHALHPIKNEEFKIYDFSDCDENTPYPILLEIGDKNHTSFKNIPVYLQQNIIRNKFDPDSFQHPNIIRYVTENLLAPIIEKNSELGQKMKSIIQQSIKTNGDIVLIASTVQESIAIKNEINTLCNEFVNLETRETDNKLFETMIDEILTQLDSVKIPAKNKAKLAFLIGQMAKKGVLGYEDNQNNQANELLYIISDYIFKKLKNETNITFPTSLLSDLAAGNCIESITGNFLTSNPWVQDVYSFKN